MSETPKLRSGYPLTPVSSVKRRSQHESPAKQSPQTSPTSKSIRPHSDQSPTIPFSLVDAPSQRLYVSLLYIALFIWRIFDFLSMPSDGRDGFWLFTKWVGVDTAFLYGLSGLNIPWLRWSSSTFTGLFIAHALFDWMLMFQIPIPVITWIWTTSIKFVYDREYAVSERYVKPASILHNSSVILGKQIIHILPEGSATLNPDHLAFCIGDAIPTVELPIQINQTYPVLMELTRVDLETNLQEQISVSAKDLRRLVKSASKEHGRRGADEPLSLQYQVRQSGMYHLQTVIDESSLEVHRRPSYALVAACPRAEVRHAPKDKCKGDLSDFFFEVDATPPLKIKYSKTVNREDYGNTILSIQPSNLTSSLLNRGVSDMVALQDAPMPIDVSWAQSQSLKIPVNESLNVAGGWQYTIDEVYDALGNKANYSDMRDPETGAFALSKSNDFFEQHFIVHDRPRFSLDGCDAQNPMKVERGKSKGLPVRFDPTISSKSEDASYTLKYLFTPEQDVLPNQRHPDSAKLYETVIHHNHQGVGGLVVREPGLYSLHSVKSAYCGGEIMEPSSCQLINPIEPDLGLSAEQIPDKCAGSSIGLTVNLDLLGTPPFHVYYNIKASGGAISPQAIQVDRLHTQFELRPPQAGHYTYYFDRISDAVYTTPRSLNHKNLVLEQDVRPPASARFLDPHVPRKACIGESMSFHLSFSGDAPFTLDYELIHRGRRARRSIAEIPESFFELQTEPLIDGGDYVLALTSIIDATGCKQALATEAKFEVGLQQPKASFGSVDGKRSILTREGKTVGLPLRLQGEPPFTLSLSKGDDPHKHTFERRVWKRNEDVDVSDQGNFEILSIHDASCPGLVDLSAKDFSVSWVPRPSVAMSPSLLIMENGGELEKKAICEGDEDATDVKFFGNAPYEVQYETRFRSDRGSQSTSTRKFTAGLDTASLKMESSEAGVYTYQISKLGDASYGYERGKFSPVAFQQRIYPKPSASFADTGKTYKYCKGAEEAAESIPINLSGAPPFQLELEIKHQASTKPERINVPNVESTRYLFRVPRRALALGSHSVAIRKVQDARGCQRNTDFGGPQVLVSVTDVPGIVPLEEHVDFCVGDRITFSLSGTPPFNVFYIFQNHERKAKVPSTDFRRIAEQPGEFVITGISDTRSTDACKAQVEIAKTIHEMPSVRVSKGKTAVVDIHEGGEAEILFEFGGTPPFHFTYTRSTVSTRGKTSTVLETKQAVSHEYSMRVKVSEEGMYEVVSIRDRYCAFSAQQVQTRAS